MNAVLRRPLAAPATGLVDVSVTASGLDPADWSDLRTQGHRMLDDMFDHMAGLRDGPVWRAPTDAARDAIRARLPFAPTPLNDVHADFLTHIAPHSSGNAHPGFMGWVQGGGTPVGMLAEMLAAGLNANLGGRDHMPIAVERQVGAWMRDLFRFPQTAGGLFVTGTSMANFMAVLSARAKALGPIVRTAGVAGSQAHLVAYASLAAHGCLPRAMDMAGLGTEALRLIAVDKNHRIDIAALRAAIAEDRAAGLTPFLVVGTAGTVDVGAIDDLDALADIAAAEGAAFHVDGAFGALAMLAPKIAPRLTGIERADTLAFDFHKWGQVPYDAGYLLFRDEALQRRTFAADAAYLRRAGQGLAAGDWWPCDLGPDLSRGFRALKTWFTLRTYGLDAIGAVIQQTCDLAQALAQRVEAEPELELLAPVQLNIVCFGYRAEADDTITARIVVALHLEGRVAPSLTTVNGRAVIRAAVVNHRTDMRDIEALVGSVLALGRAAAKPSTQDPAMAEIDPLETPPYPRTVGLATLSRLIYENTEVPQAVAILDGRIRANPFDAGAILDLSTLLQLAGHKDRGLALQAEALKLTRVFERSHGHGLGLRVLMLMVEGDLMANTPFDFLLQGSDAKVYSAYVEKDGRLPYDLPDHDVAFLAIGESIANAPVLEALKPALATLPRPLVNGHPDRIAALTRDGVAEALRGDPDILAPMAVEADRDRLTDLAGGKTALSSLLPEVAFPVIVRPVWSHAGHGLEKIDGAAALADYLARHDDPLFFVSPYVNYASLDGRYRKQRIAFIDGRPFASHMAVSDDWMVHYLSAGMREDASRRAEEEAFMAEFDEDFATRHARAFETLHRTLGLDYFAIDCAETADGRLLLFEADVAMIVHDLDDEATFPYKKPAMRKLFAAFRSILALRAALHQGVVAA